jgi:hypothetical protein
MVPVVCAGGRLQTLFPDREAALGIESLFQMAFGAVPAEPNVLCPRTAEQPAFNIGPISVRQSRLAIFMSYMANGKSCRRAQKAVPQQLSGSSNVPSTS